MEATYRQRRKLVADMLAPGTVCERCRSAWATEVHELLSRARGGSILDRDNCVALCHDCHAGITDHTVDDWRDWTRSSDGRGNAVA